MAMGIGRDGRWCRKVLIAWRGFGLNFTPTTGFGIEASPCRSPAASTIFTTGPPDENACPQSLANTRT
jgi:hypothetical protein